MRRKALSHSVKRKFTRFNETFRRVARHRLWLVCCWLLPVRWTFNLLMLASAGGQGRARWMAAVFAPFAVRAKNRHPKLKFSGILTRLRPVRGALMLREAALVSDAAAVLTRRPLIMRSMEASLMLANILFESEEFVGARQVLLLRYSGEVLELRGLLELVLGDEEAALPFLLAAADIMPHLMRPHQNLAARYSTSYRPNALDFRAGRYGRLYDFYNYLGQRVTHIGAGHLAVGLYAKAFAAQRQLQSHPPKTPTRLKSLLDALGVSLTELTVLPDEWVTQIGHLGMLDILFKMRELGWWTGNTVLLASFTKIANQAYLSLFKDECSIVTPQENYDKGAFGQLSSLQRYYGQSFNAFTMPNGEVVPWQDAGAILTREWEAKRHDHPRRDRYDRQIGGRAETLAAYDALRKAARMRPDDWFVCLHMRDATFYGEAEGTGQTHRNAAANNYLAAVRFIIDQGGYVIKLGGMASPKLPKMRGLFDYGRSRFKSDVLDLHLIRHARYFIGTTSGLTHVPLSFGVPCALVNCVTIDSQLWNKGVRFALKRVVTTERRMLSQRDLTSTPWRWRVFSAGVMLRHGIRAIDNTPDEILETVKEVHGLTSETPSLYAAGIPNARGLLAQWRNSLELPYFYGNSQPSLYYLHKHQANFLESYEAETQSAAAE